MSFQAEGEESQRFMFRSVFRLKGKSTPIPLFTNCTQGMAQEAYLKDEFIVSTTAELWEQTLTTVQEYLTAQRIPVSRVRAYHEVTQQLLSQGGGTSGREAKSSFSVVSKQSLWKYKTGRKVYP
ncbi:MAG: hypothetical protein QXS68_07255 [Candidatus Methanomethylicaceae archaeon]